MGPLQFITVYIISALPEPIPVTRPVAGFTVATDELELLQTPPASPVET